MEQTNEKKRVLANANRLLAQQREWACQEAGWTPWNWDFAKKKISDMDEKELRLVCLFETKKRNPNQETDSIVKRVAGKILDKYIMHPLSLDFPDWRFHITKKPPPLFPLSPPTRDTVQCYVREEDQRCYLIDFCLANKQKF